MGRLFKEDLSTFAAEQPRRCIFKIVIQCIFLDIVFHFKEMAQEETTKYRQGHYKLLWQLWPGIIVEPQAHYSLEQDIEAIELLARCDVCIQYINYIHLTFSWEYMTGAPEATIETTTTKVTMYIS